MEILTVDEEHIPDSVQGMRDLETSNSKQDVSFKPLPSLLREHGRRGNRKTLRASGNGRHQGYCIPYKKCQELYDLREIIIACKVQA